MSILTKVKSVNLTDEVGSLITEDNPLPVEEQANKFNVEESTVVTSHMLKELKKMNMQLAIITDCLIKDQEVE
jgi:hypothetical protein